MKAVIEFLLQLLLVCGLACFVLLTLSLAVSVVKDIWLGFKR